MSENTFLVWVNKDSGITDVNHFVRAAKSKGSDWIMAGTGIFLEDQLLTDLLNAAYGLSMKYVPYMGGGKVAKQLPGKHANSMVNNTSEQEGFYKAGTTVALAAFTYNRLEMFPNAPTFKELSKDYVYYMQLSIVGAPVICYAAAVYYLRLFKKVFDSSEWQKYSKKKSLMGDFLKGTQLQYHWQKEREIRQNILKKMGAI